MRFYLLIECKTMLTVNYVKTSSYIKNIAPPVNPCACFCKLQVKPRCVGFKGTKAQDPIRRVDRTDRDKKLIREGD